MGYNMARISINKASLDFNISRNTLYKHIKQGKLTKDADGKLDTSDLIRLYGTHVNSQLESTTVDTNISIQFEQLKQENQQLNQLLAVNEMLVNQLQQQIHDLKQDKQHLFNQLEQKLIQNKAINHELEKELSLKVKNLVKNKRIYLLDIIF